MGFFSALEATCHALLAAGGAHLRAMQVESEEGEEGGEIQCATIMRTNMRLMTHTVQSMPCGAAHGWATLTVNWASVTPRLRPTYCTRCSG